MRDETELSQSKLPQLAHFCGRRHACWSNLPAGKGTNPRGAWLARAASGALGSAHTFQHLARELESFGAPDTLVRRARLARLDALRHAAWLETVARKRSGFAQPVGVAPYAVRSLLAVATENAVEGCAGETFRVFLTRIQAGRAADQRVACVLRKVAHEGLKHAQLAWDLHAWFLTQLSARQRAAVETALELALHRLDAHDPTDSLPPKARLDLGLPSKAERDRLARQITRSLHTSRASA